MKIHSMGAELFHADRQTDRRTDMTNLKLSFRNFANALNNRSVDQENLCPLQSVVSLPYSQAAV
jgi:hypothetical protein